MMFSSQPHQLLVGLLWASDQTSLSLRFLICTIRVINNSTYLPGVWRGVNEMIRVEARISGSYHHHHHHRNQRWLRYGENLRGSSQTPTPTPDSINVIPPLADYGGSEVPQITLRFNHLLEGFTEFWLVTVRGYRLKSTKARVTQKKSPEETRHKFPVVLSQGSCADSTYFQHATPTEYCRPGKLT